MAVLYMRQYPCGIFPDFYNLFYQSSGRPRTYSNQSSSAGYRPDYSCHGDAYDFQGASGQGKKEQVVGILAAGVPLCYDYYYFYYYCKHREAISLDTQAEINPLRLYGNFCGPNPEINQIKSACKDPFHREPMDAADAVCYRHDMRYCNCDAKLTSSGRDKLWWLGQDKGPYMSVRTLIPDFIAAKLIDTEYLRCLHNADVALVKEKGQLEREGGLPVKDKAAMAKMKTFQVIFEADLQADERWMKNRGERIDGN
eukprot:jgi/Bigna1/133842/aug1.22_g8550